MQTTRWPAQPPGTPRASSLPSGRWKPVFPPRAPHTESIRQGDLTCLLQYLAIFRVNMVCSSVQFSRSVVFNFLRLHGLQSRQASLSMTNTQSLPKLMSIELVMPFRHLILCHPPLLPSSIFPGIRVFSNESALHIRWPKYWISASTSVPPIKTQD